MSRSKMLWLGDLWVVLALAIVPVSAWGQSAEDGTVSNRALKYHQVLVKRPEPGYLFDRFYNTWLDASTVEELREFLSGRVASSPTTADRLLLAFFHVQQGDDVAALEQFRLALASDPASPATWYHKALVEARTLDFETAIADLQKAGQQQPDDKLAVRIAKQLGKLLVRNQQTEQALEVWQQLLASHSGDEELHEDVIELHIDEGLYNEAAKLSQTLIEKTKDPYLAVTRRLRLGDIRHRGGDRAEALEVYTSALQQVGYGTWLEREVLAQIEQIFRREDDLTGLRKQYATLLEAHDQRIAIHRLHAQLLSEMGEADEAISAFQRILKLTPGDRANREQYVSLLSKLDRHQQAVTELEALAKQHKDDAELRFQLATLRQRAEQPDQIAEEVDRYLALSDGSEYAYLRAARLLERLEQPEAAQRVYGEMAETHAASPAAREAYAAHLYQREKKEEARAIWRELAAGADLAQTLHVVRALVSRQEHEAAFEMLVARREEFDNEPLFYGQLISAALAVNKFDEAIPWALRRVELSQTVTELESAIGQAVTLCKRADQLTAQASELESQSPRGVATTCLAAQLWEEAGDSSRADAILAAAASAGELLAINQQIRLFSQRRDWSQAAAATRRILEVPGGKKSLHVRRLVELYARDYQLDEALKWIGTWRQLSPGSTAPWLAEARLLKLTGAESNALDVLRKASLRFDDDEDLRAQLAQAYSQAGKLGDAERIYWLLYEQTEDLFGKLRWVQQLAQLSKQQDKTDHLVESFQERVRNNRRSIVPLLTLAEIHRETNNYEGRRQALTAATKIKPDNLQLQLQIARIEESEGHWEAALATLERAAVIDKSNRSRELIAQLHLDYGEAEDGFAILQELVGGEDADPRSVETLADAMCAMLEWERAAEFLQGRIDQHPNDYRLRYLLGLALEEAGQFNQAADQFLILLHDQEELPTNFNKQAQNPLQSVYSHVDRVKRLAPAEAGDWFELMYSQHTVYAYQRRRGQLYASSSALRSTGRARSSISMPDRVAKVRTFAIAHLVTLGSMMTEPEVADLADRMLAQGVDDSQSLLRLGSDRAQFNSNVLEILNEQPEHRAALAVFVLRRMGQLQADAADHGVRAFRLFRETHPQLALMAAASAALQDDEHRGLFEEALELAAQVEQPNPMVIMSLVAQLGGQPGQQRTGGLDEEHRNRLLDLVLKWYPHLQQSQSYGPSAFMYVTLALRNSGEPSRYLGFLEDEVARWQAGQRGTNNQQMVAMLRRQSTGGAMLVPLDFPPKLLIDFPLIVLAMLSELDNSNPYSHMLGQVTDSWEPDDVRSLVGDIKDPVLRVLVAQQYEQAELVDETIREMLAAEQPRADAYLLGAARATQQQDYQQASALLEKVRYLPLPRAARTRVDAALVALASESSSDGIERLKEAGRKAALRLRRGRLDANQRNELVAAMEDLGLSKEAEKLEQVAIAASGPLRSPAIVSRGYVTNARKDRISQLVAQGKRDMAIKLLAKEVAGQAGHFVSNLQNYGHSRGQFQQVRQRVEMLGMEDEVLAELDPGTSTNPRKLSDYSAVCELLGKIEQARAALEIMVERRPKDSNARTRLILLLATEDPEAVEVHLEKMDHSARLLENVLTSLVHQYDAPISERLMKIRLGYRYFEVLKDRKNAQLGWIQNLAQMLGQPIHSNNGQSLASLYAKNNSRRDQPDGLTDIQNERVQLHEQLCRSMLTSPQTARAGFRHLLAAAEAAGDNADNMARIAEETLQLEASQHPRGARRNSTQYHYSRGSSSVRFRSPEEYLTRSAWQANDWSVLDDTILPALEEAPQKAPHEALVRLVKLYRCAEDEFLEVAQEAVRQRPQVNTVGQVDNQGIEAVVDAWADRQLTADLRPLVLQQTEKEIKGPNHHQPSGYVIQYLEHLAERQNIALVLEMLDELATLYVGPSGKRIEFIKRNHHPSRVQWNAPSGRIHVFRNMMQQLIRRKALRFATLRHLSEYGEVELVQNLENYTRSAFLTLKDQEPEELLTGLGHTSWLGELDEFEALAFVGDPQDPSMSALIAEITEDLEYRKKTIELLRARHAEAGTFGTGLMLAVLQQTAEPNGTLEYVGSRLEAIGKLPEDRQLAVSAAVRQLINSDTVQVGKLSESALAAQEWLSGNQAKHARQQVAELLAAKRFEELGIESYRVDEYMSQRIPKLLAVDPASARQAFLKVCQLAEDSRRRGQWNMGYSEGTTLRGHLLGDVISDRQDDAGLNSLAFLIDVLLHKDEPSIEISYSGERLIRQVLQQRFQQLHEQATDDQKDRVRTTKQLFEELTATLGERPSSILIPAYQHYFKNNFDVEDRQRVAKWAQRELTEGSHHRRAADLLTALSLIEAEQNRGQSSGSPERIERAEYHEYLEEVFQNDQLPLTWRMYLVVTLCRTEGSAMPLDTALASVEVYNQALQSKTPIPSEQQRVLLDLVSSLAPEPQAKPVLDQWGAHWASRYVRRRVVRNRRADDPHVLRDHGSLCRALKVYLQAGDDERVREFLKCHEASLGRMCTALALLLEAEQHQLAAQHFRARWADFHLPAQHLGIVHFGPQIRDSLSAFLAEFSNDDERYFAEVVASSLPDVESLGEDSESRDARLLRLAKQLDDIDFQTDAYRNRVLEVLCSSDDAAAEIASAVAERYEDINLLAAVANNDQRQIQRSLVVVTQHCRNRIRDGDPEPLIETIDKLVSGWSGRDHYLGQAVGPLIECCYESLVEDEGSWSPEASAKAADVLRAVLKGRQHFHLINFRSYNTAVLVTHARGDRIEEFVGWRAKLQRDVQHWMDNQRPEKKLWEICRTMFVETDKENLDERMQFVRNLVKGSVAMNWMSWQHHQEHPFRLSRNNEMDSVFHEVEKCGLLSPAEITAQPESLIASKPGRSESAGALAHWLQDRGHFEAAVTYWRMALESADEVDQQQREHYQVYVQLGLVESLQAAGKQAAATEEFSQIQKEKVTGRLGQRYSEIKKSFDDT